MYSKTFILAALASLVAADLAGDASAVIETASILSSLVDGWSSGDGLSGALVIQQSYAPLSEAVAALEGSSGSLSDADITSDNVSALATLSTTVAGLLDALTSKAADFEAVGASTIVQGDIRELSGPSGSIINNVYSVGSAECDAISSLAGPVGSLSAAFGSAADAYGAQAPTFPELTCAGGDSGSDSSSAAESSAEATSGSDESAPAESSAAEETSAAASGGDETAVVSEVVTEAVCTKETCTGVASANAAATNGLALGAVAAVIGALL